MKLKSVVTPLFFSFALHAQLTTVSQLVLNGDGTVFTGEVVIAVQPFSSRSAAVRSRDVWLCSSLNIITGCAQQIVNGVLTVALLPNGGGSPAGTSYFVSYYPDVPPGRRPSVKTEYWVVPAGGPFTIEQVATPTKPNPDIQVNPAQLNPAGYTVGQYPCLQAGAFAPCGPTSPGVWGQITGTLANQTDLATALAGKAPVVNGIAKVTVDPAPNLPDGFHALTPCTLGTLPQLNTTNGRLWICTGATNPKWDFINLYPIKGSSVLTSSYPSQSGAYVATSDGSELQTGPDGACAVWRPIQVGNRVVLGGAGADINCLTFSFGAAQLNGGQSLAASSDSTLEANALWWKRGQTVASLGTCNSLFERSTAYVTDANAPTFLGAVTGGGSTKTPVVCNGTAWVAF